MSEQRSGHADHQRDDVQPSRDGDEEELASVPGVSGVAVTLDPPRAVVTCDPAKAHAGRLEAAVREAGYADGVRRRPVTGGGASAARREARRRDGAKSRPGIEWSA